MPRKMKRRTGPTKPQRIQPGDVIKDVEYGEVKVRGVRTEKHEVNGKMRLHYYFDIGKQWGDRKHKVETELICPEWGELVLA